MTDSSRHLSASQRLYNYYVQRYRRFSFGSGRILILSMLIGILAAFAAIFFQVSVDFCKAVFLGYIVGLPLEGPAGEISMFMVPERAYHWELLLIVPTLGGLLSGLLVWRFAPEAKGHGTDGVIDAYHFKRGMIRPIVPIIKTIASAITIGTGGSAGKEGPIAQITAGMASFIGQTFKLNSRQMRILIIAGLAAGIGATFRAPLAAGIFAAEVLYREMDFDRDIIMPSLVAPIIAYAVFTSFFEAGPLFATSDLVFNHTWELVPFTLVAIAVALAARLFVAVFDKSEHIFNKLKIPEWLKPALGGLLVGFIGLQFPQALSESYGMLQDAHYNELGVGLLIALIAAKMLTTSLTIGSGGSGGVFGPSIVIGGLVGGLMGLMVNYFTPVSQSAYVIVGMAGFFSAAANTPISTIFMVSEMTGSYSLLVPTMWVSTIAYIIGRGATLYKKQLWNHYEAPAEIGELRAVILEKMVVGGACSAYESLKLVDENVPISNLDEREIFEQGIYGVINKKGQLLGVIDRQSIRFARNQAQEGLIAVDLMDGAEMVEPTDSLWSALQKMLRYKRQRLFVVDKNKKPISFLKKQDISAAYDRRMSGMEQDSEENQDLVLQADEEPLVVQSVHYNVTCHNRRELLKYMVGALAPINKSKAGVYLQTLEEREELGSTAMGNQFAFPHPHQRELATSRQGIYLVTTHKPIDFGALDQKGVQFFVLFWCSDAKRHIDALARIASLVSGGQLKELMEREAPLKDYHQLLKPLENKLPQGENAGQDSSKTLE